MEAIVVITTVGSEEQANTLARELVARRHAACVNIVPGLKSFYRWQGKVRHDTELMLVIKTLAGEFEAVAATIRELHDYELPEILSFGVGRAGERFLAWIAESVDKSAHFAEDDEDDEPAFADPD
jgi:periplasmic divalent cation tolerance protein